MSDSSKRSTREAPTFGSWAFGVHPRIWDHARQNGFVIVSKDDDFRQRSFLQGAPSKVIWLQVRNAGTNPIAELLREQAPRIRRFEGEEESALLILSLVRRAVQRIGVEQPRPVTQPGPSPDPD